MEQKLKIAGLVTEIRSASGFSRLESKHYREFHSASEKTRIHIRVQCIDPGELNGRPLDPESDPLLFAAGRRGTASPLLRSKAVRARLAASARHTERLFIEILPETLTILDFALARAHFFILSGTPPASEQRWPGPALLAPFLAAFNASLLHAAAVVRNNRAAVFLAVDGGGKTTAARLAPLGAVIGDDQVLLRRVRGRFRVFGTPWGLHGDASLHAPLGGLFLLEKGPRFVLAPCPAREMIAHIWEETKNQLAILPRPLKRKAFEIICAVAATVPAWKMSFARDAIDWAAIDRALATRQAIAASA